MAGADEDDFLFDGELISLAELEILLRMFALDWVMRGHQDMQIEHEEHLTLQ